ncbi:MAG TPA: outer membrane beta-barrel protein [Candidatus Krumholzibacteria bacterium]|nr:outer membrane beta-barrel protein [Candidatus Krumholzibacteria bacterium]
MNPRILCTILAGCLLASLATPAEARDRAPDRWVLEFGPYVGYYDFDRLTDYEDFGLFGARLGAQMSSWLRLEGSFDEVYTERAVSGNSARQVSFGLHARIEPWATRWAPFLLVGGALVILDDSDDPDSYGEAYDVGLGLRYMANRHWMVRGEWVLRRQAFSRWTVQQDELGDLELVDDGVSLWGRALRIGASYVF